MLIFARGEAPLNDEVTFAELMAGVTAAMEVPLSQYRAECIVDNRIEGTSLICNRDALISSMMNLINNALESCEHPIRIRIVLTETQDGRAHIQIMDNGPGLEPQQKARMMEPFFTTKSNGTGLGLAVVQAVVRAHHGEFLLADSPMGGVSAELFLPLMGN